jgi:argininosuccinate lyase
VTLWGGRFETGPGEILWGYTTDESDRRLLSDDIEGSIAHVTMLGATGVLEPAEADIICDHLRNIAVEAAAGEFEFSDDDEDVHSAVERRLGELAGEVAGKLHTARSRNDQIALDLRLYLRRAGSERARQLKDFALSLAEIAETHAETVVPSYTHLQQAQPTTLGHCLLAYAWMALRDAGRIGDALGRMNVSPLGAGASAGTSLPIDPAQTADLLGFDSVFDNSLDAVGSRDHVAEYIFCCAQAMANLSRLAEEMILWASKEFDRVRLDDDVSTGSSALPQKRNPDIAELVRGRSARVAGHLTAILSLQKGLPLSYNRDLQEDKRLLFDSDDVLMGSIAAMRALLVGSRFNPVEPSPGTASLDLAERLVSHGVPFREAHAAVGRLVLDLENAGRTLRDAAIEDLVAVHAAFTPEDLDVLDADRSVRSRASAGGGSPESVLDQVSKIRELASGDHP